MASLVNLQLQRKNVMIIHSLFPVTCGSLFNSCPQFILSSASAADIVNAKLQIWRSNNLQRGCMPTALERRKTNRQNDALSFLVEMTYAGCLMFVMDVEVKYS